MSTVTERVAAGAAFLDERDPEWWRADVERAIDLETLDLQQTQACVLGQRCPLEVLAKYADVDASELSGIDFGYAYHAYAKHLSGMTGWDLLHWASERGFVTAETADDDAAEVAWGPLTAEWKHVITGRRAAS